MYDVFALPCGPDTYHPNARLRLLLSEFVSLNDDSVRGLEKTLRSNLKSLHTWKYSKGGTESHVCDPNLLKYVNLINSLVSTDNIHTGVFAKDVPFSLVLAAQTTLTEHRVQWENFILIASEAKGVQDSEYAALIQGLQIGADSAIYMWRCGLPVCEAVVPVILSFSDCFCICAVYLIPDCYPVIVRLSPPLCFITLAGRCALARWACALADFAKETVRLLRNKASVVEGERPIGIFISPDLFFKPLRDTGKLGNLPAGESMIDDGSSLRTNLDMLMLAYLRLSSHLAAHDLFLFPLGVISHPSSASPAYQYTARELIESRVSKHFPGNCESLLKDGCPVVVYDLLPLDCWFNDKPPPDLVEPYISCLSTAVTILNECGIAHMDLRPSNIMWRRLLPPSSQKIEVRIIDVEDAVPFGYYIRDVSALRGDPRYPLHKNDMREQIPA